MQNKVAITLTFILLFATKPQLSTLFP